MRNLAEDFQARVKPDFAEYLQTEDDDYLRELLDHMCDREKEFATERRLDPAHTGEYREYWFKREMVLDELLRRGIHASVKT